MDVCFFAGTNLPSKLIPVDVSFPARHLNVAPKQRRHFLMSPYRRSRMAIAGRIFEEPPRTGHVIRVAMRVNNERKPFASNRANCANRTGCNVLPAGVYDENLP